MLRRILTLAAAATLAAGLGVAATWTAQAGVINSPKYTNATSNAVSGYFTNRVGTYFTHIEGYLGSDGTTSLENLGQAVTNGAGVGLCDQTSGQALQGGIVYTGGAVKTVEWAAGSFTLPVKSNGDICENGLVNPGGGVPFPLLVNIPVADTVAFQVLYDPYHPHNGCPAASARFLAGDVTANPGVWYQSPCVPVGIATFSEADAGIVADGQGMTPPASQLLAVFAHLGLTAWNGTPHGIHGSFQDNSAWDAYPVFSTTNGLASGGKVLAPQSFSNDHFDELSGVPNT